MLSPAHRMDARRGQGQVGVSSHIPELEKTLAIDIKDLILHNNPVFKPPKNKTHPFHTYMEDIETLRKPKNCACKDYC